MTVNRHNYETFFLLYVDKELSAAERKAVDMFVQENPDLKMELILLQQTVIKADDINLDKKNWLYREVEITALHENLLLFADDELSAADKKSVEILLATDNKAMAEWAILQQTKLQPDRAVVFENKQLLYRKKGGRVVGFTWWRAASAAIILGFALWTGITVFTNDYKTTSGSNKLVNGAKTSRTNIKTTISSTPSDDKAIAENGGSAVHQKKREAQSNENHNPETGKVNKAIGFTPKENMTVQNSSSNKPGHTLPKLYFENINRNRRNETIVANVLPENNNRRSVSGNNDAIVKTNPKENLNKAVITQVNNGHAQINSTAIQVVNNDAASGENNSRYLNVDDDKEKRTVLGGFLRKAKRVLERTTNLKTGDGIKIAAFEIALK